MNLDKPMEVIRYAVIIIGLAIHMFYLSLPGQRLLDASSNIFKDWLVKMSVTQNIVFLIINH